MEKYFEINVPGSNIRCKEYYEDRRAIEKVVIYCTGFAGHKDNNAAMHFAEKELSKRKNIAEVVFNWPAHGDDVKKKVALDDCMLYLDAVAREVKNRYGTEELYVYGTSFGGYLVLKYISDHGNPFRKISLRCPAVDMRDVLIQTIMKSDELDKIMKGKDVAGGFDRKILVSRSFLDEIEANDIRQRDFLDFADDILIFHGTADEVVPFEESRKFAESNLIEFIPVQGADHRFQNPAHMSLANKRTMEFFGF